MQGFGGFFGDHDVLRHIVTFIVPRRLAALEQVSRQAQQSLQGSNAWDVCGWTLDKFMEQHANLMAGIALLFRENPGEDDSASDWASTAAPVLAFLRTLKEGVLPYGGAKGVLSLLRKKCRPEDVPSVMTAMHYDNLHSFVDDAICNCARGIMSSLDDKAPSIEELFGLQGKSGHDSDSADENDEEEDRPGDGHTDGFEHDPEENQTGQPRSGFAQRDWPSASRQQNPDENLAGTNRTEEGFVDDVERAGQHDLQELETEPRHSGLWQGDLRQVLTDGDFMETSGTRQSEDGMVESSGEVDEKAALLQRSIDDAILHENALIQEIVLRSKSDAHGILNTDGVMILRMTRMARSPRVRETLKHHPLLKESRARVTTTGCEICPQGPDNVITFVPLTVEMISEIAQNGLELQDRNIVALPSDIELIRRAFQDIPKKVRPGITTAQLEQQTGARAEVAAEDVDGNAHGSCAEIGDIGGCEEESPDFVIESSLRTDSSYGFPEWHFENSE